jgi:hypothetical protein
VLAAFYLLMVAMMSSLPILNRHTPLQGGVADTYTLAD